MEPVLERMSIILKNDDLKKALRKLTGFVGDTVILECSKKNVQNDSKMFYAGLCASNGMAQARVVICYSGTCLDMKMIFTSQFITMAESLSVFGDEIIIEPLEGMAIVRCGTTSVNVPFAKEAATIAPPDFEKVPTLILQLKREDFANAVCQGAYVQEDTTSAVYSRTCLIRPCKKENGERAVKFISYSGLLYAECEAMVAIHANAEKLFDEWTGKELIVKAPALTAIARGVEGNMVYLYLTYKQLVVRSGTEMYSFVPVEGTFNKGFLKILQYCGQKDYSISLNKIQLKSAFKVIGLYTETGDDRMAADITITENENGAVNVTVKDISDKNEVQFEAEGFGNVTIRVNKDQVNRAFDNTEGENVTIYGMEKNI